MQESAAPAPNDDDVSIFDKLQWRAADEDVELPHVSDEELLAWASELRAVSGTAVRAGRRQRPLVADPI